MTKIYYFVFILVVDNARKTNIISSLYDLKYTLNKKTAEKIISRINVDTIGEKVGKKALHIEGRLIKIKTNHPKKIRSYYLEENNNIIITPSESKYFKRF